MPDHSPDHTPDPGNILLNGHIDVPPERLDAVAAALPDHIALTRGEPGCLFFDVCPCPDVVGRFLVSERFTDQAAFDAHQVRAKASPWAEVTDGIPRDYQITIAG